MVYMKHLMNSSIVIMSAAGDSEKMDDDIQRVKSHVETKKGFLRLY